MAKGGSKRVVRSSNLLHTVERHAGKFWPSGLKGDSVAVTYEGARDQASMVEWALGKNYSLIYKYNKNSIQK